MGRRRRQYASCTRRQHVSGPFFRRRPLFLSKMAYGVCNTALFCSKEGAAQVRLKIGLVGDDNGHNFTFMSPQAIALAEREKFKEELTAIISRNRSMQDALQKAVPKVPVPGSIPISASPSPAALTPKSVATPLRLPGSRAASVVNERRATPVLTGNDATSDFRLRKKVLMSNPDLGSLHRELVMSGQITEAEFWGGREVRIKRKRRVLWNAESFYFSTLFLLKLLLKIRRGVSLASSLILDPKPWKVEKSRFA